MRFFRGSAWASSALTAVALWTAAHAQAAGRPAPPAFSVVPSTVTAGRTLAVYVHGQKAWQNGEARWNNRRALFYEVAKQSHRALVGVGAVHPAGVFPLTVTGTYGGRDVRMEIPVTVVDGRYPVSRVRLAPRKDTLFTTGAVARDGRRLAEFFTQPGDPVKQWDGPWVWPSTGVVSSVFGAQRRYGNRPAAGAHSGLDLANRAGTPIHAPAPGRVVLSEWLDSFGHVVMLDHGHGVFSYYLHMPTAHVSQGERVKTNDPLGPMGEDGVATGPHLHWSVVVAGERVEPREWIERPIP